MAEVKGTASEVNRFSDTINISLYVTNTDLNIEIQMDLIDANDFAYKLLSACNKQKAINLNSKIKKEDFYEEIADDGK